MKNSQEKAKVSSTNKARSKPDLEELAQSFVDEEATKAKSSSAVKNDKPQKAATFKSKEVESVRQPALIWRILRALVLGFCLTSLLSLVVALFNFGMLPTWALSVGCVVLAILGVLSFFLVKNLKCSVLSRMLRYAFVLMLSLGAAYASATLFLVSGSIDDATGSDGRSELGYSVLALKSSAYSRMEDLGGRKVGFQSADPHVLLAKQAFLEKVSQAEIDEVADLSRLVASLLASNLDAMVLPDNIWAMLEEDQEEFVADIKEIDHFTVLYVPSDGDDAMHSAELKDLTETPFVIYLSGSDSRGSINTTGRSDVNIVAAVDPVNYRLLLVSIPRDYYVQLHGTTGNKDKLTHAGIYGVEMSRNTIADLLDVPIDQTVKVGFQTVTMVVDALGGIEIDSDLEFDGPHGCHFTKGKQHVDGLCALGFARERYHYASGDRHRGQNQQQVISAIIREAVKFENISRYPEILQKLDGYFITSMSREQINSFAKRQLDSMRGWTVETYNLDGTGAMLPTYSMGSQDLYVMIPNPTTVEMAHAKIMEYLGVKSE